jgi:hypothetical protein
MKKVKQKSTLLDWFMNGVHRAMVLSVCFSLVVTGVAAGISSQILNASAVESEYSTKYDKIPINEITGEGIDPYEITGAASSLGSEKMWYEYMRYSESPVGITQINADQRLIYFDPYYYDEALVMSVTGALDGTLGEFSTANEISFSYNQESTLYMSYVDSSETVTYIGIEKNSESNSSTTNSISEDITTGWTKGLSTESGTETGETTEKGSETGSTTEKQSGKIIETNGGSTHQEGVWTTGGSLGSTQEVQAKIPFLGEGKFTVSEQAFTQYQEGIDIYDHTTKETSYSDDYAITIDYDLKTSNDTTYDLKTSNVINIDETNGGTTKSNGKDITIGGSQSIAEKLETSTGFTHQTDSGWSTSNSSTITTTYNATYFNSKGSPLPWRLVNYAVFMPMRYEMQYRTGDDDWTTVSTSYCLLTTMQGVCRNWMDNNNSYIEGWGTGEPQEWTEFWSQFFTASQLEEAYKNKLYPSDET